MRDEDRGARTRLASHFRDQLDPEFRSAPDASPIATLLAALPYRNEQEHAAALFPTYWRTGRRDALRLTALPGSSRSAASSATPLANASATPGSGSGQTSFEMRTE